ncbi:hypothetical protein, partial [Pseudomonas amygdali]
VATARELEFVVDPRLK